MKIQKHFILIFTILAGFAISCSDKKPESASESKESLSTVVKVEDIQSSKDARTISGIGIVMSESEARPSFKTGGVINKTYVKEGDLVQKGQLLATLHMDEIQAQVQQAQEGLLKAERDAKRVKNLYMDSVATLEQWQNANTALEVAKKSMEIAKFNQNYSQIKSPISGKIVKQLMKSGEITGPGTPVYVIMGIGNQDWRVHIGLVDEDWASVQKNDGAEIWLDAYPGSVYKGKITEKSSLTTNQSGTFDVEVSFLESPKALAAGMTAKVHIQTKTKGGYPVIPIEALVKTNGKKGEVFVVENGVARKKNVIIAKMLGNRVSVSSGLDGVQKVITTGAMYLEEGEKVTF